MSQRNSGFVRKPLESYDTPAWVAGVIAPHLRFRDVSLIWEPAPGKGQMVAALRELLFTVVTTEGDFFTLPEQLKADALVTNPPYGQGGGDVAAAFARTALNMDIRVIALLLRIDYDSAASRTDIFRDCAHYAGKVILLQRIKWFDGPSTPSDNHAWFIWDQTKKRGDPRIWYQRK